MIRGKDPLFLPLRKKWSFQIRIFSKNVPNFAFSCGFDDNAGEILNGKLHFLCSSIPYIYTSSSSTVSLLLHLQYYQNEPMILKMWLKIKFVLWQPRYCKLLTRKIKRKFTFLNYSFFWKRTAIVNLKKFSSNTVFRLYNFGEFYLVKFSYFSGKPNKVETGIKIFLIDTYAANIGNNDIADKYLKNSCDSVTYPILSGLAYTGWYVYKSSVYICIIYLHEIEVCSKDTITMYYFFHSKNPLNVMNIYF